MAFKMKGHTLPGIKQRKSNDLDDGRSGSAAFQQSDNVEKYKNAVITGAGEGASEAVSTKSESKLKGHIPNYMQMAALGASAASKFGNIKKKKEKSSGGPFDQSDPFAGSGSNKEKNNDNIGQVNYFRQKNHPPEMFRFTKPPLMHAGLDQLRWRHGSKSSKKSSSDPFKQSDPFAGSKKGPYDEGDTSMATATITNKTTGEVTEYPDIAELRANEFPNIVENLPAEVFKNNKKTKDGADVDSDKYSRYLSTL